MAGLLDGIMGSIIPGYEYFSLIVNLIALLVIVLMARNHIKDKYALFLVGILAFLVLFGFIQL